MLRVPDPPRELVAEVARQAALPTAPSLSAFVEILRDRFGDALVAVAMYGSCLHEDDVTEGIVDLYAVVTEYAAAYPERHLRWFNRLIPPNVFYVETSHGGVPLRAKYAVLSLSDFERGCTEAFHSSTWARFAQPIRLLYTAEETAADGVAESCARAVMRFVHEGAAALTGGDVTAADLWDASLRRSYLAELRPETGERAAYLVSRNGPEYEQVTRLAAPALASVLRPVGDDLYRPAAAPEVARAARRAWSLRRWQGRLLSAMRLTKALFTFENGIDYLAFKIERHTGHVVNVTPRMRRHPWIFMWPEIWRLLRSGALR